MKTKAITLLCLMTLTACGTTHTEEKTYRIETTYLQSNGKGKTLSKTCPYNVPCIVELDVLPTSTHGEAVVKVESLRMEDKKKHEWIFRTYVRSTNLYGKMIETEEEIYTTSDKMSAAPLVVNGKEGSQIQIKILPSIQASCKETYLF